MYSVELTILAGQFFRCRAETKGAKPVKNPWPSNLGSNGNLDLDTGIDVDNDLLDDLGGGVEAVTRTLWSAFLSVLGGLNR